MKSLSHLYLLAFQAFFTVFSFYYSAIIAILLFVRLLLPQKEEATVRLFLSSYYKHIFYLYHSFVKSFIIGKLRFFPLFYITAPILHLQQHHITFPFFHISKPIIKRSFSYLSFVIIPFQKGLFLTVLFITNNGVQIDIFYTFKDISLYVWINLF